MKRTLFGLISAFALLMTMTLWSGVGAAKTPHSHALNGQVTANQVDFQNAMRVLWKDHIVWTRMFIVDFAADSPALDATTQRLLRNQTDIGNAIKPFYGDEAGAALTALLEEHILGAADLLAAAKANDTAQIEEASQAWYANGNEIGAFLSTANPENWPLADMQAMMRDHLDATLAEATAHLASDWEADIAAYDNVRVQILEMADMLSAGIINQFPDQFAE